MSKEKNQSPEAAAAEADIVEETAENEESSKDAEEGSTSASEASASSPSEQDPLEAAKAEAAEMKNRYLRSVADLENYRRRIAREKQEIIRSAAGSVIEELLPVIDNLKLGLAAAEKHPEAKDVTQGFAMVFEQLRNVLKEQGLEALEPDGSDFDPNFHDCIAQHASSEIPEGKVIQTVRTGYRLNERLLRAASVVVSSGIAPEGNAESTSQNS